MTGGGGQGDTNMDREGEIDREIYRDRERGIERNSYALHYQLAPLEKIAPLLSTNSLRSLLGKR